MNEIVEVSKTALKELQMSAPYGNAGEWPSTGGAGGMTMSDRELLTYAAAARRNVPAAHTRVIARGDARRRQILIDRDPNAVGDGDRSLSERELFMKATIAFEHMGEESADAPDGEIIFRSARRLKNGGALFEMSSPEAASWLRQTDVMTCFISFYDGGNSVAKGNKYPIIVEIVSTHLDPSSEHEIRQIEKDSILPTRAIQAGLNPSTADDHSKQSRTCSFCSVLLKTRMRPYAMGS